jgi:hypothetical protein
LSFRQSRSKGRWSGAAETLFTARGLSVCQGKWLLQSSSLKRKEAARRGPSSRFHFRQQARPLGREEAHDSQNVQPYGAFQLLNHALAKVTRKSHCDHKALKNGGFAFRIIAQPPILPSGTRSLPPPASSVQATGSDLAPAAFRRRAHGGGGNYDRDIAQDGTDVASLGADGGCRRHRSRIRRLVRSEPPRAAG